MLIAGASFWALALLYAPWTAPRRAVGPLESHFAALSPEEVLGPPSRFTVIVGGRLIPLPQGEWRGVTAQHHRGDPPIESEVLIRLHGAVVNGVVVVRLTPVATKAASSLPYGQLCGSPAAYRAQIVPESGEVRECWAILGPVQLSAEWSGPRSDYLYSHTLDRMREGGIDVPKVFLVVAWYRADATSWALMQYFFDPAADPAVPTEPAAWRHDAALGNPAVTRLLQRIAGWTTRFAPLMEQGVAGTLDAKTVTDAMSQDDPG